MYAQISYNDLYGNLETINTNTINIKVPSEINGDENDNTISGSDEGEIINGLGGNDIIDGNGGSDFIYGGAGDDTINDGTDYDIVDAGEGIDTYIRNFDLTHNNVDVDFEKSLGGNFASISSLSNGNIVSTSWSNDQYLAVKSTFKC